MQYLFQDSRRYLRSPPLFETFLGFHSTTIPFIQLYLSTLDDEEPVLSDPNTYGSINMEGILRNTFRQSADLQYQSPSAWPPLYRQWPDCDHRQNYFPSEFQPNTPYVSAGPKHTSHDYLPPYPSTPPPAYNNLPENPLDEPYHIDVPGKQPRRVVSKTRGKPTPDDLAERPRTWRADYVGPSNTRFLKWIGRKFAAAAVVRENAVFHRKCGQKRIQVNPCLRYPGSKNAVYLCDLRQPSPLPHAPPLDYPVDQIYGFQLATSPPVHHLRAWHPLLPWYIDIRSTQPNGITIYDFCLQLLDQLHKRIGAHDMFNIELTGDDRERLQYAHRERCNGNILALKRGILRVDFLGRQCIFVGLQRGKHGLWEIKMREGFP